MTDDQFKSYGVFALMMVAVLSVAVIAGGCTPFSAADDNKKQVNLSIKPSNICDLPEQSWSVNDTPESIEKAIRFNTGRARACNGKKATS